MKVSYCVDVSDSMNNKRLIEVLDRVCSLWQDGDLVFVFNRSSAELCSFTDIVNYSLEIDDIRELYMLLFKSGSHHNWQGSGAMKAVGLAPNYSQKICITDGTLTVDDFKSFDKVIKLA